MTCLLNWLRCSRIREYDLEKQQNDRRIPNIINLSATANKGICIYINKNGRAIEYKVLKEDRIGSFFRDPLFLGDELISGDQLFEQFEGCILKIKN